VDIDQAIVSHTRWRIRLRLFLEGRGEPLDSGSVARDDACDLGKWIHGEGARLAMHPEYLELKAAHLQFHGCAAEVVRLAQNGQSRAAEDLLASNGAYDEASNSTVTAMIKLRRQLAKET
jgi:hypothetical protein